MMDASSLYPDGFHPVYNKYDRACRTLAKHKLRANAAPVRYYFIDFGIACYTLEGDETRVIGRNCQDQEVPELSDTVMYLAKPVDIFILGNVYRRKLLDVSQIHIHYSYSLFTNYVAIFQSRVPSPTSQRNGPN